VSGVNCLSLPFSVYRAGKACWTIRGHCRKNCKSGEEVKKPCNNGDYCCVPSRTDTPSHRLAPRTHGESGYMATYIQNLPIEVITDNDDLDLS
jgi:hypothetical protein